MADLGNFIALAKKGLDSAATEKDFSDIYSGYKASITSLRKSLNQEVDIGSIQLPDNLDIPEVSTDELAKSKDAEDFTKAFLGGP
jgi:hypothetical protein